MENNIKRMSNGIRQDNGCDKEHQKHLKATSYFTIKNDTKNGYIFKDNRNRYCIQNEIKYFVPSFKTVDSFTKPSPRIHLIQRKYEKKTMERVDCFSSLLV